MRIGKFAQFWFPVIAYSAIIFGISAIPGDGIEPGFPGLDKIFHVAEYMPYGFLVCRALKEYFNVDKEGAILFWTTLFVLCYGVSDEIHQYFVPLREADVWDVVADTFGGFLGGLVYLNLNKKGNIGC